MIPISVWLRNVGDLCASRILQASEASIVAATLRLSKSERYDEHRSCFDGLNMAVLTGF
jgi:hypothetical protein